MLVAFGLKTRSLLIMERFETKKSLGQHFLNSPYVPKLMADAAAIKVGETVLEVGPGTGVLTHELLARGAKVIAIETDARAVAELKETFADALSKKQLILYKRDMRSATLTDLGLREHRYKVVANIPYYLSGKLFRTFLESDLQPSLLVFLVQREVGERIARDTKESLLSLSVKAFGMPKYVKTIAKSHFTPQPKIDSAIILISDISHERLHGIDELFFFEMLHRGFGSRRKQLLGNLAQIFDRNQLAHIFSTVGIPPKARAEDLDLVLWLKLVRELKEIR
jgi:16S rRNA (adenine1518-N6/adenine1519-N6)-dimethyltransferase